MPTWTYSSLSGFSNYIITKMIRKQNSMRFNHLGRMFIPSDSEPQKIRPDHVIKLVTPGNSTEDQFNVLKELKSAKGIVLQLRENIRGNVFNRHFPFIVIRKVSTTESLPENLKLEQDSCSDYFVTVKSVCRGYESQRRFNVQPQPFQSNGSEEPSLPVSGYVVLAFKVLNDDQTCLFDKNWHEWTGASLIISDLAKVYPIRKVACYKGLNVVPSVFKYCVFIEFLMTDDAKKSQDELYALDCVQKFRIRRMCGYAAVYSEYNDAAIAKAIEDNETLATILESIPEKVETLTFYQL